MKQIFLFFIFITLSFSVTAQVHVRFELKDVAKNEDVEPKYFIAGNFNNWKPNDTAFRFKKEADGKYRLTRQLPTGKQEFKITRGNWSTVEVGLKGSNRPNRTLVLKNDTTVTIDILNWADHFKVILPPHTASKNVRILDSAFFIPQLNVKRRVWIYLPPSYNSSKKRYPVLYMHDGQNLFDEQTSGYGEWAVDELLDDMIAKGNKECIVIGIDHGREERMREYNPYESKYGKAKGKQYVDFLANDLKPYIDKHYRTKPSAKYTSIAGSSMGGLISMYAIVTYPKLYGSAGVFSPAFWVGKAIEKDIEAAMPNLKANKIYLVAGALEGKEMVNDMNSVYQILNPNGENRNIKAIEKADGEHKEWFWKREFPAFYKFIFTDK